VRLWWRRLSVSGDAWLGEENIAGTSGTTRILTLRVTTRWWRS
ncbi:unnamed protein product, partial [Ectocarpus sp. 12 AP-2014]